MYVVMYYDVMLMDYGAIDEIIVTFCDGLLCGFSAGSLSPLR